MKRVALLCALLLTAVAHPVIAASQYTFDYTVTGADALGITRAFDDGKNTVLAFVNAIPHDDRPTVTAADGSPLQTRVIGNYLVLPGLQRHVLIYSKGVVAQVQYGSAPPPYRPAPPPYAPQYAQAPATPVPYVPAPPAVAPAPKRTVIFTSSVAGVQTAPPVVWRGTAAPGALAAAAPSSAPTIAAESPRGGLAVIADETPPLPVWTVKAGSTLRTTTDAWAKRAGWTVRWNLKNGDDYEVSPATYTAEFTDALADLYAPYFAPSFNDNKPLRVRAYAKPKIIVVSE